MPAQIFVDAGATVEFTGTAVLAKFGTFNGPGLVRWSGGNITGTTSTSATTHFEISGTQAKVLDGLQYYSYGLADSKGILQLGGPSTWSGTGEVQANYYGELRNNGVLAVATGSTFSQNVYGGFTNSGQILLTGPAGVLNLQGSYTQTSTGVLNLRAGGTSAVTPDFDRVLCSSNMSLDGRLNVQLINGFTPATGNSFAVLTYGSRSGAFALYDTGTFFFDKTYGPSTFTLGAATPPATFAAWQDSYFAPGSPAAADAADPDNDGTSNLMEFATGANPLQGGGAVNTEVDPPVGSAGATFQFVYQRNAAALAEVTFQVQWSDSLGSATWSGSGVVEAVTGGNATIQEITATLPAGTQGKRFARLSVTR